MWIQDDARCHYLILRTLEDNAILSYHKCHTAKSLMDKIESKFKAYNSPLTQHKINLFRSYISRRMIDGTSVSKHVLEMKTAARELEVAGVRVPDEMQAVILMISLPESWEDVAYFPNLQLGIGKEDDLGFDNVSQRLRVAAEMRPRRARGGGTKYAGYRELCCLCRQQGHSQSNCPEDQCSKQESESGNIIPLAVEEINVYEMHYHKIKTSRRLKYTGTNFPTWKWGLSMILRDMEVKYVLKHPKPSEPTESTPEKDVNSYNKWLEDDFTCRHLILGAMDEDLFRNFHDQPTARELMDKLDAWFDFPSLGRRMALFRQYVECFMSEDTKIRDHIYHMEETVGELKRAGIEVPDEIQAVVLINSLPKSWSDGLITTTMCIDNDVKGGMKLLDSVTSRVRSAGEIRALNKGRY